MIYFPYFLETIELRWLNAYIYVIDQCIRARGCQKMYRTIRDMQLLYANHKAETDHAVQIEARPFGHIVARLQEIDKCLMMANHWWYHASGKYMNYVRKLNCFPIEVTIFSKVRSHWMPRCVPYSWKPCVSALFRAALYIWYTFQGVWSWWHDLCAYGEPGTRSRWPSHL